MGWKYDEINALPGEENLLIRFICLVFKGVLLDQEDWWD